MRRKAEAKLTGAPTDASSAPCRCHMLMRVRAVVRIMRLHELLRLTNDFVLIDVMAPLYYQDFHIKGAMSIPEPELAETVRDWPRGRRIVVYCLDKECDTSRVAARALMLMGFRDVLQYEGGKREWRDKKFEAVGKGKLLD